MNDDNETSEIETEAQGSNQLERAGDDDLGGRLAGLRTRVVRLASPGGWDRLAMTFARELPRFGDFETISASVAIVESQIHRHARATDYLASEHARLRGRPHNAVLRAPALGLKAAVAGGAS